MAINGSFESMSGRDLLSWIAREDVRGHLTVQKGDIRRGFEIENGDLISCSSTHPLERLGELLLLRGLISPSAIDDAFRVQVETGVSLAKILLMIGVVDESTINYVLREKILESALDVLLWETGTFYFEKSPGTDNKSLYDVAVPIDEILSIAVKRTARWENIASIATEGPWKLVGATDSADEQLFLARILEQHIGQYRQLRFTQCAPLYRYRLYRLLDLWRTSEIVEPANQATVSFEEDWTQIQKLYQEEDWWGTYERTRKLIADNADNDSLWTMHHEVERELFLQTSRQLLHEFRVPHKKEDVKLEELTPDERTLFWLIDGTWDIMSYMRHSQIGEVRTLVIFSWFARQNWITW